MTTIALQFLEYAHPKATPARVRERLRRALESFPGSMVLLGWDLPPRLEDSVAEACVHHGSKLYRWHPLLTSDADFALPDEWRTQNASDGPLTGFKGLPEFTFICPNRTDVQDWIAERIEVALQRGLYHGLFFDRMRFPSPAENPETHLTCFCKYCRRVAADSGLDLEAVRRYLNAVLAEDTTGTHLVRELFETDHQVKTPMQDFLDFRTRSICRVVRSSALQVRAAGLEVGLDCFSPALTRMVGQGLAELANLSDWIKIMTYPRVFGPAGLPFEMLGLANWLTQRGMNGADTIRILASVSGLPLPETLTELRNTGFGSAVLGAEIGRGRAAGIDTLLAGLALVEMETVHHSTDAQILDDLTAGLHADGLVLSWDLWNIPAHRIDQVRAFLEKDK
jgi:hypothetical protein